MQFTSSVLAPKRKTPLTLEWAEKNLEKSNEGIFFKHFVIDKQKNSFLSWDIDEEDMDEEYSEYWVLIIHNAAFSVEYVEDIDYLKKTFGLSNK